MTFLPRVYVFFCLFWLFQLRREGRVMNVTDVVQRGMRVKVKVLSIIGQKISLSMRVSFSFSPILTPKHLCKNMLSSELYLLSCVWFQVDQCPEK